MNDFNNTVKKNLHTILAVIAVIAFIWGILNIFSVFDVNAKSSFNGKSKASSVSDTADALEALDSSGTMLYVGNILFGLTNLAVAAIGILYFLKITQNKPFYDQYIGSKLKFRPGFLMGAIGAIGAVLQVICYLFCSASFLGVKLTVGVSWTTWMMLVIFAGVAVYDKFVLEKQQ